VIKVLGTNGGGFFNANSAHPYENPTALTNLVQMLLLIGIAAALTNVFGRTVNDERQGWAIFAVMSILLFVGVTIVYWSESHGNPGFAAFDVDSAPSALQAGGDMEGKEVRFGITPTALFATVTTDAGGAVDAMHDSLPAVGRHGADRQYGAGRGHLRRRRLGSLRHASLRHRHDVRRGADGGPHTRISR
jgi:K+-transporting ATPase ATPase A chain